MAEEGTQSELTASIPKSEREIRPPKNVKVGLLFQPHGISTESKLFATQAKLKDFFKRTFVIGQRNIVLMEMADATEKRQVFENDNVEGLEKYGSFRAGFTNALLKQKIRDSGRDIPEGFSFDNAVIDDAVTRIEEGTFSDITSGSSGMVYTWLKYKILDELNQEGYQIARVYEKGVHFQDTDEHFITKRDMTFDQYQEAISKFATLQAVRDRQVASQIVSLVEEAEQILENTNIAGLFGTTHNIIHNHLPEHIQSITDTSGSEQIADDPQIHLLSLLQGGTPASEIPPEVWDEAYNSYYTSNRNIVDGEKISLDN